MPHRLHISEAASLALHAMALLAVDQRRPRPTREMAETLKVSDHHLAKVMQRLGRAGLVQSQRGPHGGFRLARRQGAISLLEVYEAVEGPLPSQTCLLGRPACNGHCALSGLMRRLGDDVKTYLSRTTLGDLASGLG
ncbi:MAG: Rrf2 family transcriptional regulator [Pseudomonadota bacterium]